jgi:hypothetical protein
MGFNSLDYWDFFILFVAWNSKKHKQKQRFGNWIHFLSEVRKWETPTLFGQLERPNLSDCTLRSIGVSSL